jgi:type II secretory pathway component PulK
MAGGGIAIALVMLVVLPIAIMLGGAIWSALMGFLLMERTQLPAQADE